jgi:hypothetical protein
MDYEWLSPEQHEPPEFFGCSCGVAVLRGVTY